MKNTILFVLFVLFSLSLYSQTKVACVGNSITYGAGLNNRSFESYPAQLSLLLGDDYIVNNFGKSGTTLLNKGHRPYTKQEEYKKSIEFAADIVVIHLGINDTDPRNWPAYKDEFIGDYLALIDSYRKVNPKTRIIVSRLTPIIYTHLRFNSGTKAWHTEIQEDIELVAKVADVELIDFYETLHKYPDMIPDAIHPNAEGAKLMAKTVYSGITGDYGGLKLSPIYSDNMVLQRGENINIRGIANAGDVVKIEINGQKAEAITNNRGEWCASLKSLIAGGPYKLSIKTEKKKLIFQNVMIGDVWLCSGQSNMAWRLQQTNKDEQKTQIDSSAIRLFDMKPNLPIGGDSWTISQIDKINNLELYKPTSWNKATIDAQNQFSAVAIHFGEMLQDSLKVPIGLINNAIGGSPTESWIDRNTIENYFPLILNDWLSNDFIMDWVRGVGSSDLKNSPYKYKQHPFKSSYLFDAGIASLNKFPITGVIWYQGESNAHNIDAHAELFELLVSSWRNYWETENMPIYYVQLSSINRPTWAWFRDSQRQFMQQIPNIGMVVSSDKGHPTDVHPREKKEVGKRLARWALNKTYNKNIIPSGPLFKNIEILNNNIIVNFDYAEGLKSSDEKDIHLFEIAGFDKQFKKVAPKIENNRIIIETNKPQSIYYIRYGWQPYSESNLVNGDNLPASTFLYKIK